MFYANKNINVSSGSPASESSTDLSQNFPSNWPLTPLLSPQLVAVQIKSTWCIVNILIHISCLFKRWKMASWESLLFLYFTKLGVCKLLCNFYIKSKSEKSLCLTSSQLVSCQFIWTTSKVGGKREGLQTVVLYIKVLQSTEMLQATPRCGCPTWWSTTLCTRWRSRAWVGSRCSTSSVTRTRSSSSAPCSPRCVWRDPSTPVAPCVRQSELAVRGGCRPTAFPGRPCWTATSSPWTTTCASPARVSGTNQRGTRTRTGVS